MVIVIIYCNYLEEMYTKQSGYSQSSRMVNVFDDSVASGPGNLSLDLHLIDYTRM